MNKIFAILFCAVFVGCATGYHGQGFTGGYSDMKLQDNIFKVSFKGNGYSSMERAGDFALLRSSEVTIENGYKYFIVLETNSYVKTATISTPVTAETTGSVNMYGNTGSYNATTYYSGGETYHIRKPATNMTIECFQDKPVNVNGMIYDAEQIRINIKNAYGIK